MASSISTQQNTNRIHELDYPILLRLFPGYTDRKKTMNHDYAMMKEWIRHMNVILQQVDDYIRDNLNNTSEFAVYYDKDFVKNEKFPFESFVQNVILPKQTMVPVAMRKERQQQIHKMMSKSDMKEKYQNLVDEWYWIQFHISLLRMVFETFVQNDFKLNAQIRKLLPTYEQNRMIYKHFWFPVHHKKVKPYRSMTQSQKQQKKAKSVDQLLRQSLSPPSAPLRTSQRLSKKRRMTS